MDHCINIDVRPDPEFPSGQLMAALYAKLHRALVARQATDMGVSFPGYSAGSPHLGERLRLHGSLAALNALMASDWLQGMRDHTTVQGPSATPANAPHRQVSRVQTKSSPERLRRRAMRRHGLSEAEANARIPDSAAQYTRLPCVPLRSTSTGQAFKLFIEHGPLLPSAVPGPFNAYGLSQGGTVPWF